MECTLSDQHTRLRQAPRALVFLLVFRSHKLGLRYCLPSKLRAGPRGKPVAGGEPVRRQLAARAAVDDLAEVGALDLDLVFLQVDVPAAPRAAPAVAARLQQILGLDRRALRPQAHGRPAGGFQQARQSQAPGGLERAV